MQMMINIIGATHIFVYQVRKFNRFSILQKGCVDSHNSPPHQPWNTAFSKILDLILNAWNRLLIMNTLFQ